MLGLQLHSSSTTDFFFFFFFGASSSSAASSSADAFRFFFLGASSSAASDFFRFFGTGSSTASASLLYWALPLFVAAGFFSYLPWLGLEIPLVRERMPDSSRVASLFSTYSLYSLPKEGST